MSAPTKHVRVVLQYDPQLEELYQALRGQLEEALGPEYDGWGSDGETFEYYMYGEDSEKLARVARELVAPGIREGGVILFRDQDATTYAEL
jgi:hypothetical protein